MSLEERKQQLENLNKYINTVQSELSTVVERLGWSLNQKDDGHTYIHCPLNSEHRVPEGRMSKHIEACKWRCEGYLEDDVPLPDAISLGNVHSITIDSSLTTLIIQDAAKDDPRMKTDSLEYCYCGCVERLPGSTEQPLAQTADRIFCNYTTDERRAIYDYVISQSNAERVQLDDINFPFRIEKRGDEPKSLLEVLAAERDAKRRRISYRTKKVSTNRKSHIEVMREVIQNQMEMYNEWLNRDSKLARDECTDKVPNRDYCAESKGKESFSEKSDSQFWSKSEYQSTKERPPYTKSRESSEMSHNHKYQNDYHYPRTHRDRSRDRSDYKNTDGRYDSYSSRATYRDRSGEPREKQSRQHYDRDHRSTYDVKYKTRNDGSEVYKQSRENIGQTRERDKSESVREKRGRWDREDYLHDAREASPKERKPSSNERRKILPPVSSKVSRHNSAAEFDPYKVIKTEELDGAEGRRKEMHVDIVGSGNSTSAITSIRNARNEWSEDSEQSNSHKHERHKRKKEKKHKRKKHKKKSKRAISSADSSSDSI